MTNTFLTIENFSNVDVILPHLPMLGHSSLTCIVNPQVSSYRNVFQVINRFGIEQEKIKIDAKLSKHSLNYEFAFAHSVCEYLVTKLELHDDIELITFANSYIAKFFISKTQQGFKDKRFKLTIIDAGSEANDHENLHLHEVYLSNRLLIEQEPKSEFSKELKHSYTEIKNSRNKRLLSIIITDEIGVIFAEELLDTLCSNNNFIKNEIFVSKKLETSKLRKLSNKLNKNNQKSNSLINEKYLVLGLSSRRMEFHSNLLDFQGKQTFSIKSQNFQAKNSQIRNSNLIMGRLNVDEMLKFIDADITIFELKKKILPFICKAKTAKISSKEQTIGLAVLHYERPNYLLRALRSIFSQTLPPTEIIICDDGSTSDDSVSTLTSLESGENEFMTRFKIFRNKNLYLGALRNTAARNINTDLVFFLDDDNVLRRDALEIFYNTQRNTGAEIVGSYQSGFTTFEPNFSGKQILFSGVGIYSTAKTNWIADGNCLVKKDFFNKIGGNSEIHRIGADDHEFFLRSLFNGAKIEIVPENLVACQQLNKRLRSNQFRVPGNRLRLSYAFEAYAGTLGTQSDLDFHKSKLDRVTYQKLFLEQEKISNLLLSKLKIKLSRVALVLPYNIRTVLVKNFVIRHFLNFLPKS